MNSNLNRIIIHEYTDRDGVDLQYVTA